jgi:hypothetical protein
MATPTLIIPGQTRSSSESGGATNLTITRNATTVTISSDTGTDAILPAATASLAGIMSAAQAAATEIIVSVPGGSLIGRRPGATGTAELLDVGDGFEISAGRIDVLGQMSVTVNELGVRLVNDEASPGNSEYYGTSASGAKGYHPLPSLGGATDLGSTRNSEEVFVTSSTGGSATIPKATGLLAGVISASDQNKLNNIAPFATANSSDATLLNRANHTGTQPPSSIAGVTTAGQALMTLANPSAIRYPRIKADNSVELLDVASFRSSIQACVEDDPRLSDARTPTAHNHPPSQIAGSTTLGQALMVLANPSAIRFPRINADNSVSLLDAAAFLAAIGAGSGGTKTLATFGPLTNQAPNTNAATPDTRTGIAVLDFDDATTERAVWVGIIPEGAVLTGGFKVRLHWMATSFTPSGQVKWGAEVERMTTDADFDSWDYVHTAIGIPNGTSGVPSMTEITLTGIDSLAAGDPFRLRISRDSNDATNDTMAQDAELFLVEVRAL